MRKAFLASVAFVATLLASCDKGTPKADLKNERDTLSYAFGVTRGEQLQDFLVEHLSMDTTYMDEFIKGLNEGVNADDDKKKEAYLIGVNIGMQVKTELVKGLNYDLFGKDSTQTVSVNNLLAGLVSGVTRRDMIFTPQQATEIFNRLYAKHKIEQRERDYADWKKENENFLIQTAQKSGVKKLGEGVYYEVIAEGTGEVPMDTNRVTVYYEGSLIDGTPIDNCSHRNIPITFKANEVIPGWTEALVHMPVGSKWKLYIDQKKAYGNRSVDGTIKPFSTLVFSLELLGIEK